jgi:transposase
MPGIPITEEEKIKIRELRAQGLSGDDIAIKLKRGKSGIYKIIAQEKLGNDARKQRPVSNSRITDDEKKQILKLYQDGMTATAIGQQIDRAQSAVSSVICKAGIGPGTGRGRTTPDITDEETTKIVELREAGYTHKAIAQVIGRSPSGISTVLSRTARKAKRAARRAVVNGSNSLLHKPLPQLARPEPRSAAARATPSPMPHLWTGQLAQLVERIRKVDSGVTRLEVDVETGDYTVSRVSSEQGSL